ncbi:MAG: hypothetical protein GY913_18140 [Proteobacteria bacterium]|nr:hypothetical protein [Pseudomonadota bacterium]
MLVISLACSGDVAPVSDTGSTEVPTTDLTYYADVKPVVDTHCTRCHNVEGLGPADLTDPEVVVERSELITVWTGEGLMPPAVADPECRDFQGSDHMVLDADERAILLEWHEGGAPLGSIDDIVEVDIIEPTLQDADLELVLETPYEATFWDDSNPGNEYRCFVLDPGLDDDVYLTAMAPIIDAAEIVHHVVLTTADREELTEEHLAPQGWDCIDGDGLSMTDQMNAGWAPGMVPIEFADGYGMKLPSEQVLIVQMHYFGAPGVPPDQSGYAFRTTTQTQKQIYIVPLGIGDFSIPAGEVHSDGDSFENTLPVDLDVWGVFPHMHTLGVSYSMTLNDECVVEGTYDLDNQLTYMFDEPLELAAGESVDFECTWDNTGPDARTTTYGERTDEEMCFFFTLASVAD